jgi:hypothetical protein
MAQLMLPPEIITQMRKNERMKTLPADGRESGLDVECSVPASGPEQPAALLMPGQYDDLIRRGQLQSGEKRLMFAILADAILCYLNGMKSVSAERRRRFLEVQRWIMVRGANRPVRSGFSFESVCDAVGMEPERLRERLAAFRRGSATLDAKRFRRGSTSTHRISGR